MSTDVSIPSDVTSAVLGDLERELLASASFFSPRAFGPVHVVYGGAHLFHASSVTKIGARALEAMSRYGADDAAFGALFGVSDQTIASEIAMRVRDKLTKRPVEAICIDFEDGYGPRSDEEEDAEAIRSATELANVVESSDDAVQIGIRIKALEVGRTMRRAVRTLNQFVTTLVNTARARAATAKGAKSATSLLRSDFRVTLPKVTRSEEVTALASLLDALERVLGLPPKSIGIELMIESPRALIDQEQGTVALPGLVRAGDQRVKTVHLGAYDLTAELGVTAGDQRLDHPFCDLARMLLQISLAGTGIGIADGATTLLPIAPKSASQPAATAAIHRAWSLHATNVTRAIDMGIWQGWDLHPAQLPARYGALFTHFLARKVALGQRLRTFVVESATRASRVGQVFDDAATGQGLVTFFLRGLACGAFDPSDITERTGLSIAELESRSFGDIVQARAQSGA